ncbi:putative ABC transporter G family member 11 [Cocos nucifera]|nr:putative ABC transporter G family member 11 [Cocos nucifera]
MTGEFILENVFEIDVNRSKWWDLSVLFSMVVIYRLLFFIMIKVNEDVTPWIRGYIARSRRRRRRRRLQHKKNSNQHASVDHVNRTPSLRVYVVEAETCSST